MVELSEQKRAQYQEYQPVFWHKAADAREKQQAFFEQLLKRDNIIALVHEDDERVNGFVIATLVKAPPVYDPQGLVCTIDDYCIADNSRWQDVGLSLLNEVKHRTKEQGAVLVVVVCGQQDTPKRSSLLAAGLTVASEWYIQTI